MTNGTPTATFRDPAGSLSLEGDFAVRTIHPEARDQVMEFVTSQFCNRLQDRGDMVAITDQRTRRRGCNCCIPGFRCRPIRGSGRHRNGWRPRS